MAKITNRHTVFCRVPTEVKDELAARAAKMGLTLNAYLSIIIDREYRKKV